MKFCTKCGKPISPDKSFCTNCGNIIENKNFNQKEIEVEDKIEENENESDELIDFFDLQKPEYKDSIVEDFKKDESSIKMNRKPGASKRLLPKILIGVLLVIIIIGGIFFNKIRGQYYIFKYNNSVISSEKVDYAIKAVKVFNSSSVKELLKNSLVEMANNDVVLAESKLQEASGLLSQSEYQNMASDIKEKKIDKLYGERKYEEALREFEGIDKLGGDFKANANYEDIMLNISSNLTSTSLQSSKGLLMKDLGIYFDNFDEDPFDEIIQLDNIYYTYDSQFKLNLYKYKNGEYKLVDSQVFNNAWGSVMQGVYEYAKDKKGVFVYYANSQSNVGTGVFAINNEEIQFKGAIFANNYTRPDDFDKDGIYEVLANNMSLGSSSGNSTSSWYKIYEDGRTPIVVKTTVQQSNNNINKSNEFIIEDSDRRYLTDGDLMWMSKDELALARNEIFARHGYVFNMDEFKTYFASKSWYVPNSSYDGSDSSLNEYEIANYRLIQEWEKK